jgi:DnaJ-like protein
MTTRKPAHLSFPDWVDQQIRSAEAAGAFDNLPGKGKPIPDIDRPQDELAWVAKYLRRETDNITEVLPPALALAKEVEVLPQRLLKERSEAQVRAVIADLNDRISRAHAQPQVGPPFRVKLVNVENAVDGWREAVAASAAAPPPVVAPAPPAARRRRWFRRRPGN